MSRKSLAFRRLSRESKRNDIQLTAASRENDRRESRRSRRAALMLGSMICAVCGIGAAAGWRISGSNKPAASLTGSPSAGVPLSMPVSPPPSLPPDAPGREYVYAGSALLATSEPFRQPPKDLAVWRPGNGSWYILNSNQQATTFQFGSSGDVPVPEDFDGDGKTDFCVFRPSTQVWHIIRSTDGAYYTVNFGLSTDTPAAADYDSDGRADIAVYRPSDSTWYIVRSSDNTYLSLSEGVRKSV